MIKRWFFIAVILFVGILIGWFSRYFYIHTIRNMQISQRTSNPTLRQKTSDPLVSPLLACTVSENKPSREFTPLKTVIQNVIDSKKTDDILIDISVYFRDLATGNWTGIGENKQYSPASLFKIPILIAYFKKAETDPSILQEQIQYQTNFPQDIPQIIKPVQTLTLGQFYAIDQLLKQMIVDSDNISEELLLSHLDMNYIQEVFSDLGLNPSIFSENADTMSAKSFSLFFRILYNATYLNRVMSEKTLELLTRSNFTKGITAGLPKNIKIAHKFGERTYVSPTTKTVIVRQLHECGIIYIPNKPYLLCVMTKGTDYEKLEDIMKSISHGVYTYMTSLTTK